MNMIQTKAEIDQILYYWEACGTLEHLREDADEIQKI